MDPPQEQNPASPEDKKDNPEHINIKVPLRLRLRPQRFSHFKERGLIHIGCGSRMSPVYLNKAGWHTDILADFRTTMKFSSKSSDLPRSIN